MKPRLLILGGSGLLGSNWLTTKKADFEVQIGSIAPGKSTKFQKRHKLSFGCIQKLISEIRVLKPDIVINTIAIADVDRCESYPIEAQIVNVEYAKNIAVACSSLNVKLVHISTDHLFAGSVPFSHEDAVICPLNVYARTKAQAEAYVQLEHESSLIIRANFFCWSPPNRLSFSDFIIRNLRRGVKVNLYSDVFFTPILAESLIKNVHELLDLRLSGIFHLTAGVRLSKLAFGIELARRFDLDTDLICAVKSEEVKGRVVRPRDMSLSREKAVRVLGKNVTMFAEDIVRLRDQEQEASDVGLT